MRHLLGANNDDPAETTDREGSGDEGGPCDQCRPCSGADRKLGREQAVRKIEKPAIDAPAGRGRKEGRKEVRAQRGTRQFMAAGNNAAVGRQRVPPPFAAPRRPNPPPPRQSQPDYQVRAAPARVVSPGPPQGDFAPGATTSDRLSTFSRFVWGEEKKYEFRPATRRDVFHPADNRNLSPARQGERDRGGASMSREQPGFRCLCYDQEIENNAFLKIAEPSVLNLKQISLLKNKQ